MGEARLILWGIAEGTKNVLLTEAEREKTQHCSLQKSEKLPGGKEWFWVHPHERPDRGRSLFSYYQKGILTARADQRWSGLRRLWLCIGGDFQAMFQTFQEGLSLLSSWTTWAPNPRILWFYQNCFQDNSCHYLSLESCGLQDLFKIILGVWGQGFDSVVHLSWQVTSGFSRNKEAFHGIETLSILCVNSTVRRTHIFRNWDIHISNMPQYIGYSIEAGFLIWCQ